LALRTIPSETRFEHSSADLQKLLLEAQEIARLGSWSWDAESDEISFSSSILTILDLPGDGRTTLGEYLSHIHPEDLERTKVARREAISSSAGGYTLEYRILREGGVAHVVARARIERDLAGRAVRVYGSLQDITDRKRMEEALEQERSYLDGLFENSPDAVVVTDGSGIIQKTNRAFTRLFGFSASEAAGCLVDDLVVPRRLYSEGQEYTRDLGRGIRLDFESIRQRRDGTESRAGGLAFP